MKRPLVIHAGVPLLLLILILGFGLLTATGIIEVRFGPKASDSERPIVEQNTRIAVKPVGEKARLLVVRGAKPGLEYPIFEGQNVIGRADEKPVDVDLELQEAMDRIWSSRQHAVITCENGAPFIKDLNSSNGTFVNCSLVPPGKEQELKANDVIHIGEVQLKVLL